MGSSLRNFFSQSSSSSRASRSKTKRANKALPVSPTASIYSISTASSISNGPQTPGPASMNFGAFAMHQQPSPDMRGIIRTLQAQWRVLDPFSDHWISLDPRTSSVLEGQYQQQVPQVYLSKCGPLQQPCVIHFFNQDNKPLPPTPGVGASYQHVLQLGRDILRAEAPMWWYEDDMADGSKGMAAFSAKNQVRLEALSGDEDCAQFVMTDDAFYGAEMVVAKLIPTTEPYHPSQEEVRGFLYIHPRATEYPKKPLEQPLHVHPSFDMAPYYSLERSCSV
ncbi:hypothetical protein DM01DRAFT_1403354 [Hesseltinella vesiculosa]|uniref:Uncharacterized protein n=1 Tax=Hesseltinella vesiculosa TaxID=101127 RepID=A0A1X2GXX9_9FUNG|nr:hypothetical protein DM01DRAFT_1403354 [Hesseltinella vesiculosa]